MALDRINTRMIESPYKKNTPLKDSYLNKELLSIADFGYNKSSVSQQSYIGEVETQEDEVEIIFEYDYYSIEVPYREGLKLDVEYNYDKWLNLAIAKEGLLPTPDLEERLQMAEDTLLFLLMGGM